MRALLSILLVTGCGRLGFDGEPPVDGTIDAPDVCDPAPTSDVVAMFAFDAQDLVADTTQQHPGRIRGAVTSLAGARCGDAAATFADLSYVLLPASPAFDLSEGSIELFVRTPTPARGQLQGIVSRDANGTDFNGHLAIALNADGRVVTRLQRIGPVQAYRCSDPIPADRWVHVGVSFGGTGGFRMWVDHIEVTATQAVFTTAPVPVDCTAPHPYGIEGNANALVLGALNLTAVNGDPDPVVLDHLVGGALDQVRLRSTWVDFSSP